MKTHTTFHASKNQLAALCCAVLLFAAGNATRAGELSFRRSCAPRTDIVTLGDLAEIRAVEAGDAAELAAIELFAAPRSTRTIRVREVQDRLALRGITLHQHQLSGSATVEIIPRDTAAPEPAKASPSANLTTLGERRAHEVAREAVRKLVQKVKPERAGDQIECVLNEPQCKLLMQPGVTVEVVGLNALADGKQRFEFAVGGKDGDERFEVEATFTSAPLVAVVTHSISRGSILHEGDVELRPIQGAEGFKRLEDVLGREVTRTLAAGQVIAAGMTIAPVIVKRGDVVTVYARANGVNIKSNGRAKEDGSAGDVVLVEALQNRETFQARVTGVQVVEVVSAASAGQGELR